MEKATITGDVFEINDPELKDFIYFLLKDSSQEFIIGLSDILECIKFAEKKGEIPELPKEWWVDIVRLYPELEDFVDIPDEKESEKV